MRRASGSPSGCAGGRRRLATTSIGGSIRSAQRRVPEVPAARSLSASSASRSRSCTASRIDDWRSAREGDRRGVAAALVRRRDVREVLEAAAAREARRELPARVGGVHLDVHQAPVLGARRDGAARASRLCVGRLSCRVSARGRASCSAPAASSSSASQVTRVTPLEDGRVAVMLGARREVFDKVMFTGPVNVMRQITDPALIDAPQSAGRDVEYLGVICMVLGDAQAADAVLRAQHQRRVDPVHGRDRHEHGGGPDRNEWLSRHVPAEVRAVRRSAPQRGRREHSHVVHATACAACIRTSTRQTSRACISIAP